MNGARAAIAGVIATGMVVAVVLRDAEKPTEDQITITVAGLLVLLLLLLPDVLDYFKRHDDDDKED